MCSAIFCRMVLIGSMRVLACSPRGIGARQRVRLRSRGCAGGGAGLAACAGLRRGGGLCGGLRLCEMSLDVRLGDASAGAGALHLASDRCCSRAPSCGPAARADRLLLFVGCRHGAAGAAAGAGACGGSGCGLRGAGSGGSAAGCSQEQEAARPAAVLQRLRGGCGGGAAFLAIRATTVLIADRLAFLDQHLRQHAGGRRRNLGVDLVGRDLEQRLVALHAFAGLLQPLGQRSFDDAFAHLGHHDVDHMVLSVSELRLCAFRTLFQIKLFGELARERCLYIRSAMPCTPSAAIEVTGLVEPARHDVLKVAQIRCLIQRESVRRDPAADVHADGADFPLDSIQTPVAPGSRPLSMPKSAKRVDNRLLHRAHVRDDVALPLAQIENRIADDLARTVIGDVAAAIGLVKCDAGARAAPRRAPADSPCARCGRA